MPHVDADAARAYKREYRARTAAPDNSSTTRTYGIPAKDESGLPGEALLVAAFLRLMVADARRATPHRGSNGIVDADPEGAREFLYDIERVGFWAHLLGADADVVQERLLREAGL